MCQHDCFITHNYNKITSIYRKSLLENEYKPLGILDSYPLMADVSSYTISWVKTELSAKELRDIVAKQIPEYSFMILNRIEIIENILNQYGFLDFKNLILFIFITILILLFISYREAVAFKMDFAPYQFVLEIIGLNKRILFFGRVFYIISLLTISSLLAYFTTIYITYPFILKSITSLPMPSLLKLYLLVITLIITGVVTLGTILFYTFSNCYRIQELYDFRWEF